jgi:xanthine dehydrogenase small subunit
VRVPLPAGEPVVRCYKISKRFDQDISAVCGAFRLSLEGSVARGVRVAFGGMAATVHRAAHCEQALEGQPFLPATVEEAAALLERDYSPLSDMRASARYRLRVAQNLFRRFYADASGEAAPDVYSYGRAG